MAGSIRVFCLDLEGVLVPEIWIEVSKRFKLKSLRLTTRDVPDYDKLMKYRIGILKKEGITLRDIQNVIAKIRPLPGAAKFLNDLRGLGTVIILSDTFQEFAGPLMKQLGNPALFCNSLKIDRKGFISGYTIRMKDGKRKSVEALRKLNFFVMASGDSYNDLTMLKAAQRGALFNPPASIKKSHGHLPVFTTYSGLLGFFKK